MLRLLSALHFSPDNYYIFLPYFYSEISALPTCLVSQSSLTLRDRLDYSSPGSSVHGIFKARILKWVAIPPPGDLLHPGFELVSPVSHVLQGILNPLCLWGSPLHFSPNQFYVLYLIFMQKLWLTHYLRKNIIFIIFCF